MTNDKSGVVWRGFTPPSRRSRAGKDEVLKDGTPARDHMHVPFTPILDGRFNYKKMCPRSFYQSMHKELGDYLEKRMGYRPAIELDEETRAQRVYTDKSVDIDKVRGAVDRADGLDDVL